MKKFLLSLWIAAGLFFPSCGMEDYLYLYPIPPGNIQMELNSRAIIRLPDMNLMEYYYFQSFAIYYRIYVSDIPESGTIQTSSTSLNRINSTLYSDYAAVEPYLSSDTRVNTSIGLFFRNRNYQQLALERENIDWVLDDTAVGSTLIIDFPQTPGSIPSFSIDTDTYTLFRSNGGGLFNPQPNRYFVNSSQLYNSANINSTTNADVVDKSGITGPRYTYVSMYIVVTGMDNNYSPIYSTPTFIGIFRLPDPANN